MDVMWVLKVVLIVALLLHFRIFGRQSLGIYVLGIFLGVIVSPDAYHYLPENILALSVLLFSSYIIAVSVIDFFRNFRKIDYSSVFSWRAFLRYVDFFAGMFVISWALSFLSLPFVESFFLLVVVFVAVDLVRSRGSGGDGAFDYKHMLVFPILYFVFFNSFSDIWYILMQSLWACGIYFVFSFVKFFNVYTCPIPELKAGMMPAETVVLESGHYRKVHGDYFSVPNYVRKRVSLGALGRKVVVGPFGALSSDDIKLLRKTEFEMLRVQRVIDFRVFVVIGVIGSIII